jgi:DNA helicase-2/ATP-dependent DNA helicase PcrA
MAVAPSLDTLNPQQREAVLCTEGPLLVVAGAGSGKTRVLTHRIAHLISEGLASPSEILAITFTNRAAAEMKERVEQLVGGRIAARMWVMTFHSACGRMLRRDAELIGYRSTFTIYDQADQVRLVKSCIEDLGKDPKRFVPRAVHGAISHAKDRLLTPDLYAERVGGYFEETVASVYELYERRLSAANAMDFDDLIMKTVLLLERVPEARRHWQQAFRYVMVDEYQDTNHAQFRLVSILAEKHRNLAVVGDQDQSIYAFRGADIRNIAEFEQDFPNAVVIPLEQNYRSTQTILDAANSVIEHNRDRKPKRLWSELGTGEPLRVVEAEDEHAEARYVAGRIQSALDDGASPGEIAVFYRMNAQSRVLEDLLTRQGIDYRVVGGPKFYERAEVKDVLDNPADEVSLRRIVNQPRRGIGSTSLDRLGAYARSLEVTLWDAIADVEASPLGSAAAANVRRFGELIEELREGAHEAPVGDVMERVLTQTGYADMLEAERTIEAQGRLENLQELVGVAREFDQRGEDVEESSRLSAFLQEISLYTDQDAIDDDRGRVTLMTLHNAKGLEFPIVFMIGLEEGLFPHQRSLDEGNEGEERRLCYVGMTRAQRGLTLTYARARTIFGARGFNRASRFLDELPSEGVEWERQAPAWAAPGGGETVTGASRRAFQAPEMPRLDLSVGDEVAHSTLGEGTVIALSGDGTVTVRFREDGSERRLVLGYAPLTKI